MLALIVEEGHTTAALSACRALATAGWKVGIGSPAPRGYAASSRHAHRWHPVPPPSAGFEAFLAAVDRACAEEGYELVFGAGDAEVLALSLGRGRIDAQIPYASHEKVIAALDKLSLIRAASEAGFATPRTVEATDESLAGMELPVVVKARLHTRPGATGAPHRLEAQIVGSREDAARRVAEIRRLGGEPVLQEVIEGKLVCYTGVSDRDGKIVAREQHVAERIWPPRAGFSCRAITTEVDPDFEKKVSYLLESLGWFGIAQLQLQVPPGGDPHVIDFNGRFFASMAIALASGVNLPASWAALATGRPIPAATHAKPGVHYQWLEGDLRRAMLERRGGTIADVLDCLRYAPRSGHAVWDRADPWPSVANVAHMGTLAGHKLARLVKGQARD